MKFSEFDYQRPNYEKVKHEFLFIIENINSASIYDVQRKHIKKINELKNEIKSMRTMITINYSIDTQNEFYSSEKEYWDTYGPLYKELDNLFFESIVNSKFKESIIEDMGEQFFNIATYSLKTFSVNVIAKLQEENRLASEYTKLLASAKIKFEDGEFNLSAMGPYMQSNDRKIRTKASKAYFEYFETNQDKFEDIFDKLVKLRDEIAKELGFENFVQLGYIRMMRTDYDSEMVETFRKQVLKHIVPRASKLYERQRVRIGVDTLTYVDEKFEFLTSNPTPKGDSKFIMQSAKKMYSQLSDETREFFDFMIENELMDLETKNKKAAGGYCTYIPKYKSPFIFSNFNSTSDDIDVLTHEAGHAFQLYMSRWIDIPEMNFPTFESCEIHSMSMEFITWPWMDMFFEDDTEKYKFMHLASAIKFIPYGIVVDKFQHDIYENPNMSKQERREIWRNLEKKYLPHKNYEGCDFLEKGTWWFKQGHIFKNPFYYIDYTLAQICALQFWKNIRSDKDKTWNDYLNLCKEGGSKSFLNLVKVANLKSPFDDGCVESIINEIDDYLDNIDDFKTLG